MLPNWVDVSQSRAKKLDVLLACPRSSVKLCESLRAVHGSPLAALGAPGWGTSHQVSPLPMHGSRKAARSNRKKH